MDTEELKLREPGVMIETEEAKLKKYIDALGDEDFIEVLASFNPVTLFTLFDLRPHWRWRWFRLRAQRTLERIKTLHNVPDKD